MSARRSKTELPTPRRRLTDTAAVLNDVFIAGTGLMTVQGLGVAENWQNLLAGRVLHETGIVPLDRDHALPRVSQLAVCAAEEAHIAVGSPSLNDGRTALVVGTSKGPIEDWIDTLDGRRPPNVTLGLARIAADVAAALGHGQGPRLTLAGACASGLLALIRAADLIRQGTCDQALVVAAEASTHRLFQANFQRLGVVATNEEGCRPFDTARRGFLLAEAASAVFLSRKLIGVGPCVMVDRACHLADATHLTGPDPRATALRRLLSELGPIPVDLVHAHGTGTLQNDAAELPAIIDAFDHSHPAVFSHKHAIGHTQGAAGLIGVVLNVEMHRQAVILGNANTASPMAESAKRQIAIDRTAKTSAVTQSVVIAAGFGGTLAAVRLATRHDNSAGMSN